MAKTKNHFLRFLLTVLSLVTLIVIILGLFHIKNRIEGKLTVWQVKIPHNEAELQQVSGEIISGVVRSATDGGIKKVLGRSEVFFEQSEIAAPARSIRDDAKNIAQSLVDRLKALPAEEYKVIKQKIYESWFKPE